MVKDTCAQFTQNKTLLYKNNPLWLVNKKFSNAINHQNNKDILSLIYSLNELPNSKYLK